MPERVWSFYPVDIFETVIGESPDCPLLSGTVVGENPDYVCWVVVEPGRVQNANNCAKLDEFSALHAQNLLSMDLLNR